MQTTLELARRCIPSQELSVSGQNVQVFCPACLIKYWFRLMVDAAECDSVTRKEW